MDLLPPALVVLRYFAAEKASLDDLRIAFDKATDELTQYIEEHGAEGGLVEDVVNDKGKVTKAAIAAQVKLLTEEPDRADELAAITQCGRLLDAEAAARKAVKDAQSELDKRTLSRYEELTEDDVKDLVVNEKWRRALAELVNSEAQSVGSRLIGRVRALEERYAQRLPELEALTRDFSERVRHHLTRMGL